MFIQIGRDNTLTPTDRRQRVGERLIRSLILEHVQQYQLLPREDVVTELRIQSLHRLPENATNDDDDSSCPICLMSFASFFSVNMQCCRQKFHRNCLELWFRRVNTCPLCRSVLS